MIRTFVAIFPPHDVREALFRAAQNLPTSKDFRLVGQEKIHLTLKFLGDVAQEDLDTIKKALQPIREGQDPFEVTTSGFGAFPSEKKARILWTGTLSVKVRGTSGSTVRTTTFRLTLQ